MAVGMLVAGVPAFAQGDPPVIYDPGVNISGLTTVAADGLGDVVTTALAVGFGFLVLTLGWRWVRKLMR